MADTTSSALTIGVPKPVVMAVIADFDAYPQWASGVREVTVLAAVPDGRAERVRFTLDAGVIRDSYVLAYTWRGDDEVRWELAERGTAITEMTGAYLLADRDGGTEVTYRLSVGMAVPMPGLLKRRAEKTIIDTALKGLRTRAEQAGRESGAR